VVPDEQGEAGHGVHCAAPVLTWVKAAAALPS
jgi:hypothetical protein